MLRNRQSDGCTGTIFRCCCQLLSRRGSARSRGANAPEFLLDQGLPKTEGAGNAGCSPHPQPCVQWKKARKQVTTGTPKQSGTPCAMVYGLYVLSPGDRAFLPPSPHGSSPARLDPSVGTALGDQDHTISPS